MNIILTRTVKNKERYYNLNIGINLFEEYYVENIYGNVNYKAPTGIIKNIFLDKREAFNYVKNTILKKLKKGYKLNKGRII